MNWNVRLFFRINQPLGKSRWLDAFGRAGAEWVIIAMVGWFVASSWIVSYPRVRPMLITVLFLGGAWFLGWCLDIIVGAIVKEPRPHISFQESKLLFTPMMSWKSFPSDHAMSAWLIFFMALVFHLPWAGALLPLALWVSWGRVYAGVHYPLDIVGGVAVAGLVAMAVYYILVTFVR